ncbi:uncharacterized protein [Diabrotica undecimpunctata]|uniref:uncharacterized protein n=1 Tax=Diabrotica undecimpunctata TaxID=50387 RepID=UPI003B63EB1B
MFQAEIRAIDIRAQEFLNRDTRSVNVFILSNNQVALKVIKLFTSRSKFVWDCKQYLKKMAKHNKVTLMWVPGYKGIAGNTEGDSLAKELGVLIPHFRVQNPSVNYQKATSERNYGPGNSTNSIKITLVKYTNQKASKKAHKSVAYK